MSKVIGIVSEGPTDYLVLKAVIDKITDETNRYLSLQPERDMLGRFGNGWKGVWRWCEETEEINTLMKAVQPQIDAIVIQMDGDVIREEKEIHCLCDSTACKYKGTVFPLYCDKHGTDCPVNVQTPEQNSQADPFLLFERSSLPYSLSPSHTGKCFVISFLSIFFRCNTFILLKKR